MFLFRVCQHKLDERVTIRIYADVSGIHEVGLAKIVEPLSLCVSMSRIGELLIVAIEMSGKA